MKRFLTGLVIVAIFGGNIAAVSAADNTSTEDRLQRLERRVGKITDLTLQIDALKRENRQLRGDIETQNYQIEQLKRKQRDIYLDIDQRLSSMTAAPATTAAPVKTTDATAPSASAGSKPAAPATDKNKAAQKTIKVAQPGVSADPHQIQADYKAAYALLSPQQRRYKDAAKAFAVFLEKYPQSSLASNAQYWLAEAHYVSQDNSVALAAFEKVVRDYPSSPKVPGALFKIGRIQHVQGNLEAAKKALGRVVKEFPSSSAAGLAKERLAQIKREAK